MVKMIIEMKKLPKDCKALLDCIDILNTTDCKDVEAVDLGLINDEAVINRYLSTEVEKDTPNKHLVDRLLDNKNRIIEARKFLKTYFKNGTEEN